MSNLNPEDNLSASKARAFLEIKRTRTVIRLANKGYIKATRVGDAGSVRGRFRVEDLLAWQAGRAEARGQNV